MPTSQIVAPFFTGGVVSDITGATRFGPRARFMRTHKCRHQPDLKAITPKPATSMTRLSGTDTKEIMTPKRPRAPGALGSPFPSTRGRNRAGINIGDKKTAKGMSIHLNFFMNLLYGARHGEAISPARYHRHAPRSTCRPPSCHPLLALGRDR